MLRQSGTDSAPGQSAVTLRGGLTPCADVSTRQSHSFCLSPFAAGKANKMPEPTKKSPKTSPSDGTEPFWSPFCSHSLSAARGPPCPLPRVGCCDRPTRRGHRAHKAGAPRVPSDQAAPRCPTGPGRAREPAASPQPPPARPGTLPSASASASPRRADPVFSAYLADLGHQPHGLHKLRRLTATGTRGNAWTGFPPRRKQPFPLPPRCPRAGDTARCRRVPQSAGGPRVRAARAKRPRAQHCR